jgi:hypothetical protein
MKETPELERLAFDFYRKSIRALQKKRVPFLLGGAYAFEVYTGISRHTKDLDLFIRERDVDRALSALSDSGFLTEITDPLWIAKAHHGEDFIDFIFGSGNGVTPVDDGWFRHAEKAKAFGIELSLIPAEEMVWSKSFVMARERYDGADIAHLFRARMEQLDWERLLVRFDPHWQVLLSHLLLFGFIYPSERSRVPQKMLHFLLNRAKADSGEAENDPVCRGTLLAHAQYEIDIAEWGYLDARPSR